jgi:hypothetical protein
MFFRKRIYKVVGTLLHAIATELRLHCTRVPAIFGSPHNDVFVLHRTFYIDSRLATGNGRDHKLLAQDLLHTHSSLCALILVEF